MIRVVEKCHDYQPSSYYIDPEKLDPENYIDAEIAKALKIKSKEVRVRIDASNQEDDPRFKGSDPEISANAVVTKGEIEDRLVWLTIDFDC